MMFEKFKNSKRLQLAIAGGFGGLVLIGAIFWIVVTLNKSSDNFTPAPKASSDDDDLPFQSVNKPTSVEYTVQPVVGGLTVPWSIVFTSKTRFLVTERGGDVRIVADGKLQGPPLVHFGEVSSSSEEGLMGLAKDPQYEQSRLLYACMAYMKNGALYDKVVRFKDEPGGGSRLTLVDNIPAAQLHAGCRVKFGPDGKLYISTGDATDKKLPQDKKSLAGKILRINPDGSIPSDNPQPNSLVWSFGHRNVQGFDWQPITRNMFATEHGPTGFDGPEGGDEVNVIKKNGNYGWPFVSHEQTRDGTVRPLLLFTPAVAPAGASFYNGDALPQFKGDLFFGMLKGEGLYHVEFDKSDPTKVVNRENLSGVSVGRVRDVAEGIDGDIYFSSSNRDGRGTPRAGDDKIYRIAPKQ